MACERASVNSGRYLSLSRADNHSLSLSHTHIKICTGILPHFFSCTHTQLYAHNTCAPSLTLCTLFLSFSPAVSNAVMYTDTHTHLHDKVQVHVHFSTGRTQIILDITEHSRKLRTFLYLMNMSRADNTLQREVAKFLIVR